MITAPGGACPRKDHPCLNVGFIVGGLTARRADIRYGASSKPCETNTHLENRFATGIGASESAARHSDTNHTSGRRGFDAAAAIAKPRLSSVVPAPMSKQKSDCPIGLYESVPEGTSNAGSQMAHARAVPVTKTAYDAIAKQTVMEIGRVKAIQQMSIQRSGGHRAALESQGPFRPAGLMRCGVIPRPVAA